MSFNQDKTAQMAAWIMGRCGSPINVMKLIKLLYLSDRESFNRYGRSLTGDRMVSMPYGPVLSATLNVVNGEGGRGRSAWDDWISDRSGHLVGLRAGRSPERSELDELSPAEIQLLDDVCHRFGGMDQWELSDFTHDRRNCPEWEDPQGSSIPISYESLFRALGKGEEAEVLARTAQADDAIDRFFDRI